MGVARSKKPKVGWVGAKSVLFNLFLSNLLTNLSDLTDLEEKKGGRTTPLGFYVHIKGRLGWSSRLS